MTPSAVTNAGRLATKKGRPAHTPSTGARVAARPASAATQAGRPLSSTAPATRTAAHPPSTAPGHRRVLRQPPAPIAPRRVSGPITARSAAPTAAPPRRVTRRTVSKAKRGSRAERALAFVRGLPDHALLDRVVRGRAWIPLLGVMLVGIVAMQVEVLKYGASMGRSLQASTALQSRNELLQESVASLADEQRIERLAAGMGMVMPAPDGVGFLAARPGFGVQAVANIHAPDAQGFLSLLSSNGAVASAASPPGSTVATGAGATQAQSQAPAATSTAAPPQAPTTSQPAASTGKAAPSASPSQTASGAGAAAPTQVAPTQTASPSTSASSTGGAGVPTGG